MAQILNDSSLNIDADEYAYEDDELLSSMGIEEKDASAILEYLSRGIDD
jgi:hypothetical protein